MTTPAKAATVARAAREPFKVDSLCDAIAKADNGDAKAIEVLRKVFREVPNVVEMVSGLAWNAENAMLASVSPGAAELFRQQAANQRDKLREEGTGTALEDMLIRRISLDCIASLQADRQRTLAPGESRSLELSRFYDHQADRAHRRLLASVESLARVRKLITPIQINIAEQQVNVAGNVAASTGIGATTEP
ncbi:MAG: hypothetical protein H0T72_00055 [Chloroflexia bacterium]|nr:hypothetical protein [Chloroflexia bacterium]